MQPNKKLIAQGLYESGQIHVFLNPSVEGLVIPEHLKEAPQVMFHYDSRFAVPPIVDLNIGDEGISATLSFNQRAYQTFVPWAAVYCISAEPFGGVAWRDDVPASLVKKEPSATEPAEAVRRERPSWMKVV